MFAGQDCPRACTFGEGPVNIESLSFWPILIGTVSDCYGESLFFYFIFWKLFYNLLSCFSLQDCAGRINNYVACMSWHESHYPGEISLCALLPCLGNAGQCWLLFNSVEVSFILFCSILTFKYDVWQPRMLLTVDENLKPLSVPVRVGQAVDVVGQAGRPKTITGFQTHSTPVLLAAGDRAELATEKY